MIRALQTSAAAAALALGMIGAASAQSFSPPLSAPTPLAETMSLSLKPGASSKCTDRQSIEGVPAPTPPASSYELIVEEAGADLRVRLVGSQDGSPFEIATLVGASGDVRLENASVGGEVTPQEQEMLQAIVTQLPELRLHGRALSQGDAMYDNDTLAKIFGQMFAAIGGETAQPQVEGGSFVTGESEAGGRRVLVFGGTITLTAPEDGFTITQDVTEAYDVATGLRLYSDTVARMPAPPGLDVKEIVFRQETTCSVTGG